MTVESKDEYGLVRFRVLDAYANMPALIMIEAYNFYTSWTKGSRYHELQTWTPCRLESPSLIQPFVPEL